ncbi:ABC transporter permease [Dolosicoccus paucivorans]|uniref:ABC transporter permease n=1 Tax=Dolosicoccus paucivorans TaxID=84521 RepID=A0A1G8LCZ6_9LACT|nr:ABC transporter permease [Dolosicoccus paucivorans]PMB84297.1 ABC transporter permease [Dolosicoccus paucivorans]PMC59269.1 ABC transporter permease [Dolosicoccus paucivorans]SDI53515.1 osmoprotectant transport system permease protein [Dolosicoccus paucivorans]
MSTFIQQYGQELIVKIGEHLFIALAAMGLGTLVAVPLGILLTRIPRVSKGIIAVASILQTIPTLALLSFMIPFLGVGKKPAVVALFIYSLLPILRNTYVGIEQVSSTLKDAAKGMGMTPYESIAQLEVPMAVPVIMSGIRLSMTYVLAWTTLAAYIGAGGLGDFIFNGLTLFRVDLILAGTIPVTIMAVVIDQILGKLEERLTPQTSAQEAV